MSDWKEKSLGQLAKLQKGRKVVTSDYRQAGYEAYLGASSIGGGVEGYASTQLAVMAEPGDVLMLWDGERSGLVGHGMRGVVSSTVQRLLPSKEISGTYLYYHLSSRFDWIQGRRTGTGVPHVPKDLARILTVKYPVNPIEQERITDVLASLDRTIEKTEALIAKYQQIKAGLMHDLFTRGVTADGELRPPHEQAPELYQETPLGWIPKGWDAPEIGDVFDIQLGKMLNKLAKTGKGVAPYLGNRAVQWDFIDSSAIEEMDFSSSEREKFSLVPGDLLVCEGGDVGRTAMWRGELKDCYFQKAIHRLRPKSDRAMPAFMLRFMRFAKENGYFREFTSQSSIAHLTQEKLSAISMLLPKPDEQKRIAEQFEAMDRLIQNEGSNLYKLHQQKLGLMSDLLTSKVRVKLDAKTLELAGG